MIFSLIFDLFFSVINLVLDLLDFTGVNEFSRNIPELVIPDFFHYIAYFIDGSAIMLLIKLEIGWIELKIAWAILLRIKSFIPTISST